MTLQEQVHQLEKVTFWKLKNQDVKHYAKQRVEDTVEFNDLHIL